MSTLERGGGRVPSIAWLLAVATAGAARAAAGGDTGPTWTHDSAQENWIGRVVSIGNEGTQVFSALGVMDRRARLFSAHDADPPSPILEDAQTTFGYRSAVDSALHAPVHGYLNFESPDVYSAKEPILRRYSSSHGAAEWSWSFPFLVTNPKGGVGVSGDGEIAVGWAFDAATGNLAIAALAGDSGTLVSYTTVYTSGEPKGVHLSTDASLLYISSNVKTILVNPLTGEIVQEIINWDGVGWGHALSGDGCVFAQVIPPNRIRVYERQPVGYEELLTHSFAGSVICNHLGLSGDGSILGAGFDHSAGWLEVSIQVLDLGRPQQPVVLVDTSVGEGSYSNVTSDIAVAENGSTVAVALWGDEMGLAPEVRVYTRRDHRWGLSRTHDLPGSANDVDLSPDGRWLAVASKGVHANQVGGGGRIDLYAVDDPELALEGPPQAGRTVRFRHRTVPGGHGRVLFAPRLSNSPVPFPGAGLLYLDRNDIGTLPLGTADDAGLIETAYQVPGDSAMIGTSIYFQGMGLAPRAFTDNWVKLTILP